MNATHTTMTHVTQAIRTAGRIGAAALAVAGLMLSAACGSANAASNGITTVKIALSTTIDEPLWEQVNKNLEAEGAKVRVETVPLKNATIGDQTLDAGDVDLSAQQHYAYLKGQIDQNGYEFTSIGETYITPLNVYSEHIKDISELKDGDKVLIPNDITNGSRALLVLQEAGLIKVDPSKNDPANGKYPGQEDIISNPKNIEIVPTDASMIMPSLHDAAAGIAISKNVVDYGKSPEQDAIYSIDPDPKAQVNKPWINVIVARTEDKDRPEFQTILDAYYQDNVRDLINNGSKGAEIAVF